MQLLNQAYYPEALEYFEQSLAIREDIGDRRGEGTMLNNIGGIYSSLGEYSRALEYYEQSLAIREAIGDRRGEGTMLNNIGFIYSSLGEYSTALDYYEQSLAIREAIGDRRGVGESLNNIGVIYSRLGEYSTALDYYEQSLAISEAIGDRRGEGTMLNNIGFIYDSLGEYSTALDYYEQSLAISEAIGDRRGEGTMLNNIGVIYSRLGEYSTALDYYEQSLAIREAIGDREGEGITLANIGRVLNRQEKPEVAIVFLKKSVNVREFIRQNALSSQESQKSYLNTVAYDYRFLADLLLEQGRILEAQQVLELLKVEEIKEFTRGEVLDIATREIKLSDAETAIWEKYDGLIDLGKRLEQQGCNDQGFRCQPMHTLYSNNVPTLTAEFNTSVESFISEFRDRLPEDPGALNPENFIGEADDTILQTPGTALIYPVVLDDKLWVLWATSSGVVNSVSVPVSQQELGEAVLCSPPTPRQSSGY